MERRPRLLIVGSINRDVIFYGPNGSEMKPNGCLVFDDYQYFNGGKGANQAAVAARLGAEAALVGAVGADADGDDMIRGLADCGLDVRFIKRVEGVRTGFSAMFTMPDGSYVGTNVLGANKCITPEMAREALERQSYDMVLMQLEMPLETAYGVYELARERGIPVLLDAGPAKRIDLERLDGIYMISPNEAETEALTGIAVPDAASALRAARALREASRARYVLLKLGGRGALLLDGDRSALFPAFRVDCVDSTGAGDTFTAALAIQLCQGRPMEEAIRYANAAGAVCVSRKGGLASVPSAAEVDAFLRQR